MSVESYLDEERLSSDNIHDDFVLLSGVLATLASEGIPPSKRSTVYEAPIGAGLELVSLLYHPGHLDDDLRLALQVQIDRLPDWDDRVPPPAPSTADFARIRCDAGEVVLCVVTRVHTTGAAIEHGLHIVGDLNAIRAFLRALPELLDLSEQAYIEHCQRIFDRLLFKPGISAEIRSFSRPYRSIREDLHRALIALNDIFSNLLDAGHSGADLANRFRALSGFEVSPESPQTHKNRSAMKEREVSINDAHIMCEWHLKLEPRRDRIHIGFYDARIGNGRQILVGIFCDHLTT